MSKTSLLHLANELILKILSEGEFDSDELLSMACVCRRFNTLAIDLFLLKVRGVSGSNADFDICCEGPRMTKTPTETDALAIAFSTTSVDKLTVTWRPATHAPSYKEYHRVVAIISRLTHIHCATFMLKFPSFERHWGEAGPPLIESWQRAVGVILNTILEKSCTDLTVTDDDYPFRYNTFHKAWVEHLPGAWIRHIARKVSARSRVMPPPNMAIFPRSTTMQYPRTALMDLRPLSDAASKGACSLRHLTIGSIMLLYPPCHHWTSSLIAASDLSSLTIDKVDLNLTEEWQFCFGWLYSALRTSKLQKFSLLQCHLERSLPHLFRLVTSLSHLTHLTIDGYTPYIAPPPPSLDISTYIINKCAGLPPIGRPKLPNLVEVSLPVDFIPHLVGPGTLPTLKSTTIIPCQRQQSLLMFLSNSFVSFSYVHCAPLLHTILTSPTLMLNETDVTLDLRKMFFSEHLRRDLEALGIIDANSKMLPTVQSENENENENENKQATRVSDVQKHALPCYTCVTGLIMPDAPEWYRRHRIDLLGMWLTLFVRLREVSFVAQGAGLLEGDAVELDAGVRRWCPNIERIKVRGVWRVLQPSGGLQVGKGGVMSALG